MRPILIFALLSYISSALKAEDHQIPRPFTYELYQADVSCWIERRCRGPVARAREARGLHRLLKKLRGVENELLIAIYGLRQLPSFIDQLLNLKENQVQVRATIDQERGSIGDWHIASHFAYPDAYQLAESLGSDQLRVDVNRDGSVRTGSLMHHKFMVLDRKSTWFGSTNLSQTELGKDYNANVSILVDSPELASYFTAEFQQMFHDRRYSIHKKKHAQPTLRFTDGTTLNVYFSPQDKPLDNAIIPFIDQAERSLEIAMFYLTYNPVIDALIQAQARGVKVRIITDATAARQSYQRNTEMRRQAIDVRVENWGGKMHMKSAIRDGRDVVIGSANWTQAGHESNDEHLVIVRNNPQLATEMSGYFENLYRSLPSSLTPGYREPRAESPESINSCEDGIDNDYRDGIDSGSCLETNRLP